MKTFQVSHPSTEKIPVLISVPHCGTAFPPEIRDEYQDHLIGAPDDTDWFVDQLYDFAPALGITMVTATLSRWVIDLNRNPESKPLYDDGRIITALCPATTFLGAPLYRDARTSVEAAEVSRRSRLYFDPYHRALERELAALRSAFGKVLLWDCHSIRKIVPTIQKDAFPDLILGSADGKSAPPQLIQVARRNLEAGTYKLTYNHPFKGGYITRHYGQPMLGQFALQLEMTKINYMDDDEKNYHPERAERMREILGKTLKALGQSLIESKDY